MSNVLENLHGPLLVVRPPVPATLNKGGANYKSEVKHLSYSPRAAYDEWLAICEGIIAFGGDALFDFEAEDDRFLDHGDLGVEADGTIRALATGKTLGSVEQMLTGRVFAANGPWVVVEGRKLRALLPNMLSHRVDELPYYLRLLERIAEAGGYELSAAPNPHRWEGMADITAVGEKVVLTYTVAGHYDQDTTPKTMRSSREGVQYAADFAGVSAGARIHAELIYPHFHGDTVQFSARPPRGAPRLVQYPGGLWGPGAEKVRDALGAETLVPISRDDAVEQYAGNSRQVEGGVLVPDGVSPDFTASLEALGLGIRRIALFELFGKAGGGPACATLYLPRNLELPADFALRYSRRREEAQARRERLPERLEVDPAYFAGRKRG